jgi:hypothetical protein
VCVCVRENETCYSVNCYTVIGNTLLLHNYNLIIINVLVLYYYIMISLLFFGLTLAGRCV